MQNTRVGAQANRAITPVSVENGTEIYDDLSISLDDIPEKPGITTILQRPGGRIIRHTANVGTPGTMDRLLGNNKSSADAITSAAQSVHKTVTEHPVASAAVFFAIGYLVGRKRR